MSTRHNCSFIRIANDASRFLAGFSPDLTIGNHRAALPPVPAFLSLALSLFLFYDEPIKFI